MSIVYHILTESEPFSEFKGGAISRWAANVLANDNDAVVVAPSADESWGFAKHKVRTVPALSRYKEFRAGRGRYCPGGIRRMILRDTLRQALPDLTAGDTVWVHNRPEAALAVRSIVKTSGARVVLHMHNSHLLQRKKRELNNDMPDRIVFCSRYLQREAESLFGTLDNGCVLYNGASQTLFHPPQERANDGKPVATILVASRLVPEKGVHILARAMRILHERNVAATAIVIGSSQFGGSKMTPYVEELRKNAPPNIQFHDYCVGAELAGKFRSADIFCLPSVWHDPFPLAPLEAMATALPVVATISGGIPEALSDGGGFLVSRGSAKELANNLQVLTGNPELRSRLGNEGYASFCRNFTWDKVSRNYRAVISSLKS